MILKKHKNTGLTAPDILLPAENTDMYKWAVVACDQYTSDPDYWRDVENIVGDSDSTYNFMLPEIYLEESDADERIEKINARIQEFIHTHKEKNPVLARAHGTRCGGGSRKVRL